MKSKLLIVFLFIVSIFLFAYKVTQIPIGINGDEASIGYNAALVARLGYDENDRSAPLFIQTLDGRDWKQPIFFYSVVATFKLLGASFFTLRLVSVLFAATGSILVYYLLSKLMTKSAGLFGWFVFVTTPIIFIQSRLALENITAPVFILLWLIFLYNFLSSGKVRNLFFSGLSLCVGVFSYNGMRLIVPILALLTVVLLLKKRSKNKKVISASFLLGFLPLVILLPIIKTYYPGALFGNNRPHFISNYRDFFTPVLSFYDLSFLFLKGDSTLIHSTGAHGMYLLAAMPLFFVGIYKSLKDKAKLSGLMLAGFLFGPILYGLTGESYRASRLLALVPFFVYFCTYGFTSLLHNKNSKRYLITSGILFIILLNFIDFHSYYFNNYPERVRSSFNSPIQLAIKSAKDVSINTGYNVFIEKGIVDRENQAVAFFSEVYFQKELDVWDIANSIPKPSVLIANENLDTFDQGAQKIGPNIDYYAVYKVLPN